MNLEIIEHPGLCLLHEIYSLPRALGELPSPDWLTALLCPDAEAPLARPAGIKATVRDLFRGHGYRPTGRGKPSSEYLVAAAADGRLGSINAVVDVGNAVSLHSGLPISVVDVDRCAPPLRVAIPEPESRYIFNPSGQEIDVVGLLSLSDAEGPCANAVKDAQRTKTTDTTTRVLTIVWGVTEPEGHAEAAGRWLHELFERL